MAKTKTAKTAKTAKTKTAKRAAKAGPAAKSAKPATPSAKTKSPDPAAVDAWIAARPPDQQPALAHLRKQIRAAAPDAIETVAWNVPMYYAGTTPLFGLNAFAKHMSFGVGPETFDALHDELADYDVSKGTIRFTPDRPLPAKLIKKLIATRIAQHRAKR